MSSLAPAEMNASTIIQLVESGSYPREVVLTIARGFLPLEQEDLVSVLAHLATLEDEEISGTARVSLSEVPSRVVLAVAGSEAAPVEHLERLMRASSDNTVLEALIRNRTVPDAAVAELAQRAEPSLQDAIVINHSRILRAPEILDALLANPKLSPDVNRRVLETREEFFDKKARARQLEPGDDPELENVPLDEIADLLEKAEQPQPSTPSLEIPEADLADPERTTIWQRLLTMSISEKVKLAFKGDKTVRMILVRDRNKLICSATMRNPRMTDTEVEAIAGMRNVDEEVLRLVGMRREWMAKYPIVLALIRNPKAPLALVLPLINRLTLRDLKTLKDDKGVAEVVRTTARKTYQARTAKS